MNKKQFIIDNTDIEDNKFYFEFDFDNQPGICLCYDYNWSNENEFEICYVDMKESGHVLGSNQIRYYV